jgi:hypothetical protein
MIYHYWHHIALPLSLRSSPQVDVSKDVGDIDSETPYRAEAAGLTARRRCS